MTWCSNLGQIRHWWGGWGEGVSGVSVAIQSWCNWRLEARRTSDTQLFFAVENPLRFTEFRILWSSQEIRKKYPTVSSHGTQNVPKERNPATSASDNNIPVRSFARFWNQEGLEDKELSSKTSKDRISRTKEMPSLNRISMTIWKFNSYKINIWKWNKQQGKLTSCQLNFDLRKVKNNGMPLFISLKPPMKII